MTANPYGPPKTANEMQAPASIRLRAWKWICVCGFGAFAVTLAITAYFPIGANADVELEGEGLLIEEALMIVSLTGTVGMYGGLLAGIIGAAGWLVVSVRARNRTNKKRAVGETP